MNGILYTKFQGNPLRNGQDIAVLISTLEFLQISDLSSHVQNTNNWRLEFSFGKIILSHHAHQQHGTVGVMSEYPVVSSEIYEAPRRRNVLLSLTGNASGAPIIEILPLLEVSQTVRKLCARHRHRTMALKP